jgi:hypothetical protein
LATQSLGLNTQTNRSVIVGKNIFNDSPELFTTLLNIKYFGLSFEPELMAGVLGLFDVPGFIDPFASGRVVDKFTLEPSSISTASG